MILLPLALLGSTSTSTTRLLLPLDEGGHAEVQRVHHGVH